MSIYCVLDLRKILAQARRLKPPTRHLALHRAELCWSVGTLGAVVLLYFRQSLHCC